MLTYEEQLDRDVRWALCEGSKHFEERSEVHHAMRRLAQRLDELQIPYAVVGAMAMFVHGYRRFTEDVNVIVTMEALKQIHRRLVGKGYVRAFRMSKNLRDSGNGVRIEFLVADPYPADGKSKPIAVPDPASVASVRDGIAYAALESLIELKLASGMTVAGRLKDIADVQALIDTLRLRRDFADRLNPFVRDKYRELWTIVRTSRSYLRVWHAETPQAITTIDDLIAVDPASATTLSAMKADGVTVDTSRAGKDYVYLATSDPEVASKYDMHPADEFIDDDANPIG